MPPLPRVSETRFLWVMPTLILSSVGIAAAQTAAGLDADSAGIRPVSIPVRTLVQADASVGAAQNSNSALTQPSGPAQFPLSQPEAGASLGAGAAPQTQVPTQTSQAFDSAQSLVSAQTLQPAQARVPAQAAASQLFPKAPLSASVESPTQAQPSPAAEPSRPAQNPALAQDARDRIFYPGDTERLKPLATKLLRNTLLDQKEIWTSPFRMRRQDAKWWIGAAAVTGALIATDHRSSTAFENSSGQVTWGNNISKIGAAYTLLPVVAGFYAFGVLRDDAKPREVGVLGAEALLDSLIVVGVMKPIFGRNRPDSSTRAGHFFDGGDSFPSGHAIESWALASVIVHEYAHGSKVVPLVVYGLAGTVSAARFAAQRHYASDIVAGGAMGWFIGRYVFRTHEDHAIHGHGLAKPVIAPVLRPSERLYELTVSFGK